jgi:hypothetical protein
MIAFLLVALCAIPMMSTHVHMYKEQKKMAHLIELDHVVNLLHAQIVEDLYVRGASGGSFKELLNQKIEVKSPELAKLFDLSYELTIDRPRCEKDRQESTKFLLDLMIKAVQKERPNKEYVYNTKVFVIREFTDGQNELSNDTSTSEPDDD